MDTIPLTGELTMLRVDGWQLYVWRDDDAVTLVDTGAPGGGERIVAEVGRVDRIVLTHGHVDHCGAAFELRTATGASVCAGAGDADVIRGVATMAPAVLEDWERPIWDRVTVGLPPVAPAVPVDVSLVDGDVLDFGGGAHVLEIPGHTAGSIAVYLPRYGVLFTGDTVANVGALTLGVFNQDRALAVDDFRRLAALDVRIACFGHGDPILDGAGERLRGVAAQLVR